MRFSDCLMRVSGDGETSFEPSVKGVGSMYKMKKALMVLSLAAVQVILTGFGSTGSTPSTQPTAEAISRHIAILTIGKAQQKAPAPHSPGHNHPHTPTPPASFVDILAPPNS